VYIRGVFIAFKPAEILLMPLIRRSRDRIQNGNAG
jgi:hypothetical protein